MKRIVLAIGIVATAIGMVVVVKRKKKYICTKHRGYRE